LRPKCPPVYNQGPLRTCTSFAVAKGLGEFLLRRRGDKTSLSATHFYGATEEAKMISQFMVLGTPISNDPVDGEDDGGIAADDGHLISAAMATLEMGGAVAEASAAPYPPEAEWAAYAQRRKVSRPGDWNDGENEPVWNTYFMDTGFTVKPSGEVAYIRLETKVRIKQAARLRSAAEVRRSLADGMPVVCGLDAHESFYSDAVAKTGDVPLPAPGDALVGGHAMLIVGYDDNRQAFLVRNSWGAAWGEQGYCRIPYAAVRQGILHDFWTVDQE
jgi:hypothetical protein